MQKSNRFAYVYRGFLFDRKQKKIRRHISEILSSLKDSNQIVSDECCDLLFQTKFEWCSKKVFLCIQICYGYADDHFYFICKKYFFPSAENYFWRCIFLHKFSERQYTV